MSKCQCCGESVDNTLLCKECYDLMAERNLYEIAIEYNNQVIDTNITIPMSVKIEEKE